MDTSWFATLAQLGFAISSLFSMDSRPENIAEQRGIVSFSSRRTEPAKLALIKGN